MFGLPTIRSMATSLSDQANKENWTHLKFLSELTLLAKKELRLPPMLSKLGKFSALIIYDLGYVQQSREEMEVLFTLIADRYEKTSKRATVPHNQSRYSVPVQYATKHIVLRAYIDRVEIHCEDRIIATHDRVQPGDWSLQLAHYIALLETKPGLLDSGKPFVKHAWTQSQRLFRTELEFRYQGDGTRMFIDILLLAKRYDWSDVCRAIDACCKSHAFNEKAVLLELQGICLSAPWPTLSPKVEQTQTDG